MPALRRCFFALGLAISLTAVAVPASATSRTGEIDQPAGSAAFDALILRPFGLAATVVGVALAIPATALTALGRPQDIPSVWEVLVGRPARYTFVDPVGSH